MKGCWHDWANWFWPQRILEVAEIMQNALTAGFIRFVVRALLLYFTDISPCRTIFPVWLWRLFLWRAHSIWLAAFSVSVTSFWHIILASMVFSRLKQTMLISAKGEKRFLLASGYGQGMADDLSDKHVTSDHIYRCGTPACQLIQGVGCWSVSNGLLCDCFSYRFNHSDRLQKSKERELPCEVYPPCAF